jgi:hypothetical protein
MRYCCGAALPSHFRLQVSYLAGAGSGRGPLRQVASDKGKSNMTIFEQLKDVRFLLVDQRRELFLAWFGGHGIHAYDITGKEVGFWNTGDCSKNNADIEDVVESMKYRIKTGEYD